MQGIQIKIVNGSKLKVVDRGGVQVVNRSKSHDSGVIQGGEKHRM